MARICIHAEPNGPEIHAISGPSSFSDGMQTDDASRVGCSDKPSCRAVLTCLCCSRFEGDGIMGTVVPRGLHGEWDDGEERVPRADFSDAMHGRRAFARKHEKDIIDEKPRRPST